MATGGLEMPSETLILDIRRAQAEAAIRAVRDWKTSDDITHRARLVEALAKEALDSPRRLRELANDVIEKMPKDGTLLDYLNRQHATLSACFALTLDALRATRDLAKESEESGHRIPSLPALEAAIEKSEQVRKDAFEHWELFDEHPELGLPEDWLTTEEVFRNREAQLSPEARRELQSRLDQAGK
jgi:hypothetical protein